MRQDEGAAFARCPHCAERPAAGHHLVPLNLEADGCEYCSACAKICSDIRNHIVLDTPSVFVDYGTGRCWLPTSTNRRRPAPRTISATTADRRSGPAQARWVCQPGPVLCVHPR
jgi:hypothetical protein